MLTLDLQNKIRINFGKNCQEEQCGLIYKNKQNSLDFFSCRNASSNKENFFIIHPIDYLMCSCLGEIEFCVHSHPGKTEGFSEFDKQNSETHNIKSILYLVNKDQFLEYEPCGYRNYYVGRAFCMGRNDCFTLIKDYYKNELGIIINDNLARDSKSKCSLTIQEIIHTLRYINPSLIMAEDNNNLQKHDILIFDIENDYPHLSLFLGDGTMLHQKLNKESTIEEFSSLYKKKLMYVFRAK